MKVAIGSDHGVADLTHDELVEWGRKFGAALKAPALVALSGELGAGKTTLVQSICAALGVTEQVTSPTYALVHQYRGQETKVFHLDLYRLNSPDELTNIGWDEILDEHAVVLVEWPDRAGSRLSSEVTRLALWHIPDDAKRRRIIW